MAGLSAWVAGCATLMAWGYGLSLLQALAPPTGWAVGLLAGIVAAIAAARTVARGAPAATEPPARLLPALYAGVIAVLAAGLITALAAPPSNWDSLTYHLARVGYYLQQGSLADYGANYYAQEEHARGASILLCAIFSLSGRSDLGFALPQLGAYVACLAAVYALARQLGAGVAASRAAAAAGFGLLTVVALEVPTAQNDLLLDSFIGAGLVGAMAYLRHGERSMLFLSAGGFALAVTVKASALTCGPAAAIIVLGVGARSGAWRRVGVLAVTVGLAMALFGGPAGYWKNLRRFGNPLGSAHMTETHLSGNGADGRAQLGLLNLVRFAGDFCTLDGLPESWGGSAGAKVKHAAGAALRGIGLDAEAPAASRAAFSWTRPRVSDENISFFGWPGVALLLPGCVGALLLWRRRLLAGIFALAAGAFFIEQAFAGPYDPWRGRHFILGAIFAAPAAAWLFESSLAWLRRLAWLAAVVAAVAIVPALLWRGPNPLVSQPGAPSVFAGNRLEAMARHHPSFPALAAFNRLVPANATVIVAVPENEYEYALFGARLGRRLIPWAQAQRRPELMAAADFLLRDGRMPIAPDPADTFLGYRWGLRRLHPLRPGDFVSVTGLYPPEEGFAWMAEELRLHATTATAKWANIELGARLPQLPPARRITVIVDGQTEQRPIHNDRCSFSIPLSAGREHEIQIVSQTGARSPREIGLSPDARPLTYRVRVLNLTDRPIF